MDESEAPSQMPVYAALIGAGGVTFACLASQLGPGVIVLVIALGGFALFGALHYWTWGWRLTESDDRGEQSP